MTYHSHGSLSQGEFVSMGVASSGAYGVKQGVIFSMPVTISGGQWSVVPGLDMDDFSRDMMDKTADELFSERATAEKFVS